MYVYRDRTNKNLNSEYFKYFYKPYYQSGNKKHSFNNISTNNLNYSNNFKNRNLNNYEEECLANKHKGFFYNYFNNDVQIMNMKIDLKVIEHKLNYLLNIYSPDEIYIRKNQEEKSENNSNKIINEKDNEDNNLHLNSNHILDYNDNEEKNSNIELNINNNKSENDSVNSQNMQMAIEKVISYDNIIDSEEKNKIENNKNLKKKKNNIIHLLDDKKDKKGKFEEDEKIINKNNNNDKEIQNNISGMKIYDRIISITSDSKEKINKKMNDNRYNDIDNNNDNEIDNIDNFENNNIGEEENIQLLPEKESSIKKEEQKDINNLGINLNNKKDKKVHFDDNLVYINYDEDDFITEFELTDKSNKIIPYKHKDFTKYLRLLTSVSNKLTSIMCKTKKRKKKKTKIMERNIEFIKEIEKGKNIYGSNEKDPIKRRLHSENKNYKNCRKFMENPQQFFTEDLCDVMLLQYDIDPKEHFNTSMSSSKKTKDKKKFTKI